MVAHGRGHADLSLEADRDERKVRNDGRDAELERFPRAFDRNDGQIDGSVRPDAIVRVPVTVESGTTSPAGLYLRIASAAAVLE